ncbi:MAG: NAD(P)H-dependent oxidoreductase [Dethiobacter sp.]|jgi:multimeric flavodoxin WrbA|nr:NAD(P)H-dependent oxidoreductase [Dethiobacter sp.]
MLVLGLAGSPRCGGNSEILLDEALDSAAKAGAATEKIALSKQKPYNKHL